MHTYELMACNSPTVYICEVTTLTAQAHRNGCESRVRPHLPAGCLYECIYFYGYRSTAHRTKTNLCARIKLNVITGVVSFFFCSLFSCFYSNCDSWRLHVRNNNPWCVFLSVWRSGLNRLKTLKPRQLQTARVEQEECVMMFKHITLWSKNVYIHQIVEQS